MKYTVSTSCIQKLLGCHSVTIPTVNRKIAMKIFLNWIIYELKEMDVDEALTQMDKYMWEEEDVDGR